MKVPASTPPASITFSSATTRTAPTRNISPTSGPNPRTRDWACGSCSAMWKLWAARWRPTTVRPAAFAFRLAYLGLAGSARIAWLSRPCETHLDHWPSRSPLPHNFSGNCREHWRRDYVPAGRSAPDFGYRWSRLYRLPCLPGPRRLGLSADHL